MKALLPDVDPDGLLEFSVVFTDRSLNHMSAQFQKVMRDISEQLCHVYNASSCAIVPGGGTFAMEAVARQFSRNKSVMVLRNGWFSFRWTQIFETGDFTADAQVLKARRSDNHTESAFRPLPIEDVVAEILDKKPDVFFAPHVETASGIILPDAYLEAIGAAVRSYGGLFVLDCIASGCIWVDMQACNVDVLISAPQKGWSASPCAGLVMLNERAEAQMAETESDSFAANLKTWAGIMRAYTDGGHAYHATMPTDSLRDFRDTVLEMRDFGYGELKQAQWDLGKAVRAVLAERGFKSVAGAGFEAPGVVVSYTSDPAFQNGSKFAALGVQIAAGVPLRCDEPEDYSSFRIGLFGLEKLYDVNSTVGRLTRILDQV
ncbi:class V aminotransferase [Amylibacter marinus]|uniref:Class V aminotransferase n=1 Tax=Amylibacter marinus TaxID=1475483 RepID=A0ABQ5VT20_9RHOB|nr:aminotransferase class V-fold PLP-dependent enzyme [Amylibacter marinus]GLQ34565.1 class V aminotransferase [Amylibacter marinus]